MESNALEASRLVIAIDGPAAAGKSTVASAVARRIDGLYFDTGVIYRALTLVALERGVDPDDANALARVANRLGVDVTPPTIDDGRLADVRIDGRDVTWEIRASRVDRTVSAVSAHAEVRDALIDIQRRIGRSGRVVMAGRDIGTIVMPDADLTIWLDASIDERAHRRHRELCDRGVVSTYEDVREDMRRRDERDAGRDTAPMKPALSAIRIQTDHRTVEEIVDEIIELAREHSSES